MFYFKVTCSNIFLTISNESRVFPNVILHNSRFPSIFIDNTGTLILRSGRVRGRKGFVTFHPLNMLAFFMDENF